MADLNAAVCQLAIISGQSWGFSFFSGCCVIVNNGRPTHTGVIEWPHLSSQVDQCARE